MQLVQILVAKFIRNSIDKTSDSFYQAQVWSSETLTNSLNNSQINCSLVDLIDVTLAWEDANSKLVEVVTVAVVDAEKHIGNSLLQILELRIVQTLSTTFGHDFILKFKFRQNLKLEFGRYFVADVL